MSTVADALLAVVALSNLALLSGHSTRLALRLLAAQGASLGALVLLLEPTPNLYGVALAAAVAVLKGALYPWALARTARRLKLADEVRPQVGATASLALGIVALALAFALAPRLTPPGEGTPGLAVPCAMATIVSGLLLIVTRRAALAQVLGYVVLENGIFLFALVLVGGLPLLLEFGGLLEVFFAVFVMAVAVDRIGREFSTTDVEALGLLRG